MNEPFKIPVISPWYNIKKRKPNDQERVLVYCPTLTEQQNGPLIGFQFGTYFSEQDKFELETATEDRLYKITYWARLTVDLTSVAREDKQTTALFKMLGVKIN